MFILRRSLILLAVVVLSVCGSQAQSGADKVKVKVRISSDPDSDARVRPYTMIRSTNNAIMMLRNPEMDVRAFTKLVPRLDLYDRTKLAYVRSQEPSLKAAGEDKLLLEELVYFGGRPLLIARGTGEKVTLYFQPVDPALTRLSRSFEPLCSWDMKVSVGRPLLATAGSAIRTPFGARVSADSTHMLIYSPEVKLEQGGAVYLLAMVDPTMKVLWQQTIRVADKAKLSEVMDVELDNAGNAYVLVKNNFSGRDEKDGAVNYELKLFTASEAGIAESAFPLDEGTFAIGAMMQTLVDGRVACAGLYGDVNNGRMNTVGNFVSIIDSVSGTLGQPVFLPFTEASNLNETEDPEDEGDEEEVEEEKGKKKKQGISWRKIDVIAMLPRADGGFFLVNEVNYTYEYRDAQTGRSYTRYAHGNVQARCITKDGRTKWSKDFPRSLTSGSPVIGRVFAVEFNDALFLFLLDSEQQAEKRKAGDKMKPNQMKAPYSAYVSFDDGGNYKIKPVLRSDRGVDYISGWDLVRTGPNEYFALGTEKLSSGRFLPVKIEFSKEEGK